MSSFSESFRHLRRSLKAKMPYVRRRFLDAAESKYSSFVKELAWSSGLATMARLEVVKPIADDLAGEVCFFVSYAPRPHLKAHVRQHIAHLLRNGIKVVLIVNTDIAPSDFVVEAELADQLSAIYIRENIGFDFAAWAHIYALCNNRSIWTRLYLINDSIVGPVKIDDFDRLLERVRTCGADFIGLTENTIPTRHIQSFFMVLNQRVLHNLAVQQMLLRTLSFATKWQVIDVYETQLTGILQEQGLTTEALFPPLSNSPYSANDTFFRWQQLVHAGFPYIKTSVIKQFPNDPLVQQLVPPESRGGDY